MGLRAREPPIAPSPWGAPSVPAGPEQSAGTSVRKGPTPSSCSEDHSLPPVQQKNICFPVSQQQNTSTSHWDGHAKGTRCTGSRASQALQPGAVLRQARVRTLPAPHRPGAGCGRGALRAAAEGSGARGCLIAGCRPASNSHLPTCSFFSAETSCYFSLRFFASSAVQKIGT